MLVNGALRSIWLEVWSIIFHIVFITLFSSFYPSVNFFILLTFSQNYLCLSPVAQVSFLCYLFWEGFCLHHYAPFAFHSYSLLAVSFPALPWQEMQGEAEKSAELNRDAQLGQHNRLQRCVNTCVHECLGLLHRNAEKGKERETDTERKVRRCWY